jgi:hypothetical protein
METDGNGYLISGVINYENKVNQIVNFQNLNDYPNL